MVRVDINMVKGKEPKAMISPRLRSRAQRGNSEEDWVSGRILGATVWVELRVELRGELWVEFESEFRREFKLEF
jgi:hypothetical protein